MSPFGQSSRLANRVPIGCDGRRGEEDGSGQEFACMQVHQSIRLLPALGVPPTRTKLLLCSQDKRKERVLDLRYGMIGAGSRGGIRYPASAFVLSLAQTCCFLWTSFSGLARMSSVSFIAAALPREGARAREGGGGRAAKDVPQNRTCLLISHKTSLFVGNERPNFLLFGSGCVLCMRVCFGFALLSQFTSKPVEMPCFPKIYTAMQQLQQ